MPHDETLIIGIGNSLLSDEGAGIHALYHLQSKYPDIPNLTFLDGGTLSFTLATWIEDCTNLIVFDAAELHQPAGSVKTFVGSAMDEYLGSSKRSAHEVGLLDLIHIARITNHLPENRALIGIQPQAVDWGMEPTALVRSALDQTTSQAVALIKHWQTAEHNKVAPLQKSYCNQDKRHPENSSE
jgi:hydrogenase maturation protease